MNSVEIRKGYRGYMASRGFHGSRAPQHVQNLVIRDYCQRRGLHYLLSATEYAMPGCYMMLEQTLEELPALGGIVMYSLFMLPGRRVRRREIYRRVLAAGASLHGALEGLAVHTPDDAARVEELWDLQALVAVGPGISVLEGS
jgi:sporadic carbohydrate cluster protein (TIGR04323 family)